MPLEQISEDVFLTRPIGRGLRRAERDKISHLFFFFLFLEILYDNLNMHVRYASGIKSTAAASFISVVLRLHLLEPRHLFLSSDLIRCDGRRVVEYMLTMLLATG